MKKSLVIVTCCLLALPINGSAYSTYSDDNPFVEAMLRMMEIFGLIDRDRLPSGVPYLPAYGQYMSPGLGALGTYPMAGLGGFPASGGLPGLGGVPGMSPFSGFAGSPAMSGLGGLPGGAAMPGMGMSGLPYGMPPGAGWPPGNRGYPGYWGQGQPSAPRGRLDGVWELENGTFVVIQADAARLYLSQERYQDFAVRYDRQHLSWKPLEGTTASTYRYQVREGRMILSDQEGKILLLRRRR